MGIRDREQQMCSPEVLERRGEPSLLLRLGAVYFLLTSIPSPCWAPCLCPFPVCPAAATRSRGGGTLGPAASLWYEQSLSALQILRSSGHTSPQAYQFLRWGSPSIKTGNMQIFPRDPASRCFPRSPWNCGSLAVCSKGTWGLFPKARQSSRSAAERDRVSPSRCVYCPRGCISALQPRVLSFVFIL